MYLSSSVSVSLYPYILILIVHEQLNFCVLPGLGKKKQ